MLTRFSPPISIFFNSNPSAGTSFASSPRSVPTKNTSWPALPQLARHRQRRDHVPARAAAGHQERLHGRVGLWLPARGARLRRWAGQEAYPTDYPACSLTFIRIPNSASVLSSELPP